MPDRPDPDAIWNEAPEGVDPDSIWNEAPAAPSRPNVAPVREAIFGPPAGRPWSDAQADEIMDLTGRRAEVEAQAAKYEAGRTEYSDLMTDRPPTVVYDSPSARVYAERGGREAYLGVETLDEMKRLGVKSEADAAALLSRLRVQRAEGVAADREAGASISNARGVVERFMAGLRGFFEPAGEFAKSASRLIDPALARGVEAVGDYATPDEDLRRAIANNPGAQSLAGDVAQALGGALPAIATGSAAGAAAARAGLPAAVGTVAAFGGMGAASAPPGEELSAFARNAALIGLSAGTTSALTTTLARVNPMLRSMIVNTIDNTLQSVAANPNGSLAADAVVGAILGIVTRSKNPEKDLTEFDPVAEGRRLREQAKAAVTPVEAPLERPPQDAPISDTPNPAAFRTAFEQPGESVANTFGGSRANWGDVPPVAPEPAKAPEAAPVAPAADAPVAAPEVALGRPGVGGIAPSVEGLSAYERLKGWQRVFRAEFSRTGDLRASVNEAERQFPGAYVKPLTDSAIRAEIAKRQDEVNKLRDREARIFEDDPVHLARIEKERKRDLELARDLVLQEQDRVQFDYEMERDHRVMDAMVESALKDVDSVLRDIKEADSALKRVDDELVEIARRAKSESAGEPRVAPALAAPESPAPKAVVVGKTARGETVVDVNGAFYTRSAKGKLSPAHPDAVREARAAANAPRSAEAPAEAVAPPKAEKPAGEAVLEAGKPATATTPPEATKGDLVHVGRGEYVKPGGPKGSAPTTPAANALAAVAGAPRSVIRGVADAVGEAWKRVRWFFSSNSVKSLLERDPTAWRALIRMTEAEKIGDVALAEWEANVAGGLPVGDRPKFGAALVEANRLGIADQRRAQAREVRANIDRAKSLIREAREAEAAGLKDEARAKKREAASILSENTKAKAASLEREAAAVESTPANIVGPDRMFETRAEYDAFIARDDVKAAAERHRAWWDKHVEPRYKVMLDIDPSVQLPVRGRGLDVHINLVRPQDAPVVGDAEPTVRSGRLGNIFQWKSRFARKAYGTAEVWELDPRKYLAHTLKWTIGGAEWKSATNTLLESGLAVRPNYAKGEKPPKEIGGERAVKLEVGGKFDPIYVPESLAETLRLVRKTEMGYRIPIFTAIANGTTAQSLKLWGDNVFNVLRALTVPAMRPTLPGRPGLEAAANVVAWPVMRLFDVGRVVSRMFQTASLDARLKRAEAGTTRKYGDAKDNPFGTRTVARLGTLLDKAARDEMNARFDEAVKAGKVKDTPESRQRFVNQMGAYNRAWYGPVERMLVESGLNPFAEAWRTARGNAARTLTLDSGMDYNSRRAAWEGKLVMLSKLAGLFTTVGIWNALQSDGDPLGHPSIPAGSMYLGDREDGSPIAFDPWKFMGVRQLLKMVGVDAALNGLRKGMTPRQMVEDAERDVANVGVGLISGPLVQVATVAASGSRPGVGYGPVTGPSVEERAAGAFTEAFPQIGITAKALSFVLPEPVAKFLVMGEETSPDAMDEVWSAIRSLGVSKYQPAGRTETLPERREFANMKERVDFVRGLMRRSDPSTWETILSRHMERVPEELRPRFNEEIRKFMAREGSGR